MVYCIDCIPFSLPFNHSFVHSFNFLFLVKFCLQVIIIIIWYQTQADKKAMNLFQKGRILLIFPIDGLFFISPKPLKYNQHVSHCIKLYSIHKSVWFHHIDTDNHRNLSVRTWHFISFHPIKYNNKLKNTTQRILIFSYTTVKYNVYQWAYVCAFMLDNLESIGSQALDN